MIKLPEGASIGIVEALTALALGVHKTPEQCQTEMVARLEQWGRATNLPVLLHALEARARGEHAGDIAALVDRLVSKTGKPLDALIDDLKIEIATERDVRLRIGRIERRILDAARARRVTLIAEKAEKGGVSQFAPIPAEQFEYRMAVHLPTGSITVSYDASEEDYVRTAETIYNRVRIACADVEALARALEAEQHGDTARDFSASDWNCVQAIAWVFTRDQEAVTAKVEGAAVNSTIQIPAWMVAHNKPNPERTIDQAKHELRTALRRGDVSATGFRNGTGNREDIPTTAWADLRFNDGADMVGESDPWRPGAVQWTDVRIDSAKLLIAFPAPIDPTPQEIWEDENRDMSERIPAVIGHLIPLGVCGRLADWHGWVTERITWPEVGLRGFEDKYWHMVPPEGRTKASSKVVAPPTGVPEPEEESPEDRPPADPTSSDFGDFSTRGNVGRQKAQ